MTKYFVAITTERREYTYRIDSMIAVPTASAEAIADALNKAGYKLKPGEVWYIYENDWMTDDYIMQEIRSYSPRRNIKVYKYCHG